MPRSPLFSYNKKRDFTKTSEPKGQIKTNIASRKLRNFVVQKHEARRLHYDLRLESEDGALKSWAVPKGPSLDSNIKRLAVMVEDHPFDYLHFEGSIPKGNYGAGTVIVWDTGSYTSDRPLSEQLKKGKVSVELYGNKLRGLFSLIRTKESNQWLLIKAKDQYVSAEDITSTQPQSVLTGRSNSDIDNKKNPKDQIATSTDRSTSNRSQLGSLFQKIKPMLASPFDKAFNNKDWVFEVKWDGVRAILFKQKKEIRIQSRNGNDITKKYPEIVNSARISLKNSDSAVIDGEIVVLNEQGRPDFNTHQHRINIQDPNEIMALSVKYPSTYYVFDILYKEGKNVEALTYMDRRHLLLETVKTSDALKISDYIEESGIEILRSSKELKLEGIVAKHKMSLYKEGVRSRDWLKIKNTKTQDCVIIGYTKGEGSRVNYFGSLVLAVYYPNEKKLKFAGHVGTGFDDETLDMIYSKIRNFEIDTVPVDKIPYLNRETKWLRPVLIAEVKFGEWTKDGILRAPVFLRLREDKNAEECIIEADNPTSNRSELNSEIRNKKNNKARKEIIDHPNSNKVNVTNPTKIYWKATKDHSAFLKRDLIVYYEKIADYILPHLDNRPLSLSRYPNGIYGKSFYQKDWNQKRPDFVSTAKIHSERRGDSINYIVCNNVETLLWIANLGCIEMHPWYSRINDFESCNSSTFLYEEKCGLNFPDFIVFDLDPYIYSGKEKKGQEPEYNPRGFKAAVEIAHELNHILGELKIRSYLKTSGKSGLHIYVPILNIFSYEQTKSFAEVIANMMVSKFPKKVTLEWSTIKRKGKVFFDYNQNARGKTIASVYSLRPTVNATVSMPVEWKKLDSIFPTDFTILSAPEMVRKNDDYWQNVLSDKQDLRKIISQADELL
ncbi:MAG: DNA ligase D [Nitrososphaeraceae archaeon]|nr:DNA ligase D [Nitrososphaeraceae archaeon]